MDNILTILFNVGIFDAVIILLIAGFTIYGFLKGIVKMAGDLFGILVGVWTAGHYFIPFYNWTESLYMGHENAGKVISFLLLLAITRKVISLAVAAIDKFIGFINIIPFLGLINRMAGALLGFLSGAIFFGVLIYFLSRYSLGFGFDKILVESSFSKFLLAFGEFVSPLLPEVLRQLHSLI